LKHCPVFTQSKAASTEPKLSPMAKLQQANVELQAELNGLKRSYEDGSLFDLKRDTAKHIAKAWVREQFPP
jgi:hypothetical protein